MMPYLIDTNVLSETLKPRPDPKVTAWFAGQRPEDLFLSSVSLGELMRGASRAKDQTKRGRLTRWIEDDLTAQFRDRVLPFNQDAAMLWGRIMGDGDKAGHPRSMADAQIAAVARRHGLTLVTRNTRDFESMDVALVNPWTSPPDNL